MIRSGTDASMYTVAYAGAEGLFGINLWPQMDPSRFALLPDVNFYEFIPLRDKDKEQPKTLFMEQVRIRTYSCTKARLTSYLLGPCRATKPFKNVAVGMEPRLRTGDNHGSQLESLPSRYLQGRIFGITYRAAHHFATVFLLLLFEDKFFVEPNKTPFSSRRYRPSGGFLQRDSCGRV